ncbi:hypothetical protein ACIRRI_48200 [Streptomyces mirabilis]|uniref:hypothetical protein n=1 Tax=Streptomyces mirabilis TaxID=68239 RepID=UPI003817DBB1
MDGGTVTVSVRHRGGEVVEDQAWLAVSVDLLGSAAENGLVLFDQVRGYYGRQFCEVGGGQKTARDRADVGQSDRNWLR